MYFVVFLAEPQRYAVIPCMWIYDDDVVLWEKFVNKGMNSAQNYLCYWTSQNGSENHLGAPNELYEPNFAAQRATLFPCNNGTYICRIVKYKADYTEACEYRDRRRHLYPAIYNERLILQRPIPIVDFIQENAVIIEADDKIDDQMGAASGINGLIAELIEPNIHERVIDVHAENANAEVEGEIDAGVDDETVNVVKTEKVIYGSALEELEQFLNDEDSLIDPNEATDSQSDEIGCDPPNEEVQSVGSSAPDQVGVSSVIEPIFVNNMPTISSNDAPPNSEVQVLIESASSAEENVSNEESLIDGDSLIDPNETTDSQSELSDDNEWGPNGTTVSQSELSDENGCDPTTVEAIGTSDPAQKSIPSVIEPIIVNNMPTISSNDAPPNSEVHVLFGIAAIAEENVSNEIGSIITNEIAEIGLNNANNESPTNGEPAVLGGAVGIETVVTIDDEITMTFTGTQIGRPIQSVSIPADFVKREADRISGEIPYKEDKLGRKYIVGRQIITIREPAIKMLLLWSTHPYCDRKRIDEKVVQTLLMSSVSAEELEVGNIKEPLKIFIEDIFRIRVKGHAARFSALQSYMDAWLKKKSGGVGASK